MANPNPFFFGGSQPSAAGEVANPFMDASQGMAEVNPFMAQQQNMMGQPGGYNSFNQFGHPAMAGQTEAANPFGGYPSMGYQAQNMMYYGNQAQAQNPYYNQFGQMAHMNTNTNSVPSNAGQPASGIHVSHACAKHDPHAMLMISCKLKAWVRLKKS